MVVGPVSFFTVFPTVEETAVRDFLSKSFDEELYVSAVEAFAIGQIFVRVGQGREYVVVIQ